ncbi:HalOD1 output domain-containing protein [Halogeometricum borinquense]|uniref:HalOD1 output domain-containing protein n=1 Tax=Halogeometricum borinquense TaxID=60847 RepID=UPI001F4CF8E0|nr:HalOD1 output domain-containing protein [Halogeometricum borinquense]
MATRHRSVHETKGRTKERLIHWHDFETPEPVSEAVIEAVSELKACDKNDLPPLSDRINRSALNSLFGGEGPQQPKINRGELTFTYDGVRVTVDAIGMIRVVGTDA